jgi:hypothetical protein
MAIGALSVGALWYMTKKSNKKSPTLDVAQAVGDFASILEEHDIKEPVPKMKRIEKKIAATEPVVSSTLDWILTGIQMWKNIKK